MGGGAGGRSRANRTLRLLLLLVLSLGLVEYLLGFIPDASPLKTYAYLYTPIYNATQPGINIGITTWSKLLAALSEDSELINDSHAKNNTLNLDRFNVSKNSTDNKVIPAKVNQFETARRSGGRSPTVGGNHHAVAMANGTLLITKMADGIRKTLTTEELMRRSGPPLPLCDQMPPDLGPVLANKTDMELIDVEKKFPDVYWGGRYIPPNCTARHKVAIIVPYRNRQQHLAVFLNHMHPFLMKQQIEYGIFIVKQEGSKIFNRAKLMNVGFVEAQRLKAGGWQCFIFHDIDLLPIDSRNLYSCPRQPRHMSASIDKHNFRLTYENIFGGVTAMTLEQFTNVNGFSNKFWGWGGEDDDMFKRLTKMNYHRARYRMSIARYVMLHHKKSVRNPKRYELLFEKSEINQDGLSTLEYELVDVVQYHLYTQILANIDERS